MPASVLLAVVVSTGPEPRVCRIQTAAGSDVDEGAHGPQRAQVHEVPDPSGTRTDGSLPAKNVFLQTRSGPTGWESATLTCFLHAQDLKEGPQG